MDSEVFAHLTDRGVELAKKLAHGGKVLGLLAGICLHHNGTPNSLPMAS